MRRARGWKAHVQEEDKKTKGTWSRKMVHSHVLKRSMMKTQEVGGFKGSSTRVVDESACLGRGHDAKGAWLKRTTHSCMLKVGHNSLGGSGEIQQAN